MNNLKRFLALVLAMSMMLTAVPFGAFAADDGIATASVTLGTKPEDGTMTGEPFNDDPSLSDNSPEHTNYRIPGMVMLNDGTLVATADIRYDYEYDGGGSDIVVSRSEDDGANWNYSVVAYLGDQGNVHALNASTMMDPVIITDGTNLYLLYDLFPAGYSLSGGSNTTHAFAATGTGFDSNGRLLLGTTYNSTTCNYYLENGNIYATGSTEPTGYTVDEWFNVSLNGTYVSNLFFADSPFYAYPTSYVCMQTSTDGGKNWSDPELLNIKHDGTKWQVLGPGSGIVTSGGELAFTVYNSDNSISLVHGKSGDWTTVKTYAATNESSVVELSDGTIRAFVKNGNNVITYVDFTKSGDTYTAGSAKTTGISNTGWCMISSMMYSKQIDGQDVIMVCCPSTGSSTRANGKIHVFKLDSSNNMTHVKSHEINGSGEFFAYSDMVEMEDGKIALLYEDGCMYYNGSWDGAGVGYSHIEYITVDPVADMGLTFDESQVSFPLTGDGNIQVPESAGVNHIHVEETTVSGLTTAYSAYNVALCTDAEADCTAGVACTNVYTGSATVTLPLTDALKSAADVKGFVVESDGTINSIYDVANDGESVTFVTPHLSVIGIAEVAEEEATYENIENITVYIDETKTIPLTGYVTAGSKSNEVADMEWGDVISTETANTLLAGVADDNAYEDGTIALANCLYTFTKNEDGTYTISGYTADGTKVYLNHLAHGAGFPNSTTSTSVNVGSDGNNFWFYLIDGNNGKSNLYFHNDGNNRFNRWTADTPPEQCLFNLYRPVRDGETASTSVPGYVQVSNTEELDGGRYLIVASYNAPLYVLHPSTVTSTNYYDHVAKITTEYGDASVINLTTTITITGKSSGNTSVVIGDTKYNITVKQDIRNITLRVGETVTSTIEGVVYSEDDIDGLNTTYAVVDQMENKVTAATPDLVAVTEIESGKEYIIVCKRSVTKGHAAYDPANSVLTATDNNNSLHMNGPADLNCTELWTINKVDGGYTVMRDGQYLSFEAENSSLSDQENILSIALINGNWIFKDGNYYLSDMYGINSERAHGYSVYNDDGNYWLIYEVGEAPTAYDTVVTFKGESAGTTTATVGRVTYNITVEEDIRDITMLVGQTKTDTITSGDGYTMDDADVDNEAVAILENVENKQTGTRKDYVAVTAIESGKQYLLVNNRAGKTMTGATNDRGMVLEGTASADNPHLWTIEGADGTYTVRYGTDGGHLNVNSDAASLSVDAVDLNLVYTDGYWLIKNASDSNCCLNDFGSAGNTAAGWSDASSSGDSGSKWTIYEIVDVPAVYDTTVTFKGVTEGETTATVGHVTYNITVTSEHRAITVILGQTATDTIEGKNYSTNDVTGPVDTSVATIENVVADATTTGSVGEAVQTITAGKYVIYTYRGAYVTNTQANTHIALSTTEQTVWNVAVADSDAGTYYVTDSDGKYLYVDDGTAGVTETETAVKLISATGNDGDAQVGFFIQNANNTYKLNNSGGTSEAYGKSPAMGSWSIWQFKPYTETTDYSTTVTFKGVDEGETTATVGHVTYNITVTCEHREITVTVGQTATDTIEDAIYTMDNAAVKDSSIAGVKKVEGVTIPATKELVPVTEIVSGNQYIIVCKRSVNEDHAAYDPENSVLTATDNGGALHMNGPVSTDSTELWTITQVDGGYTVTRGDQYLTIGNNSSGVVSDENVLTVNYTDNGWTIKEDGYYLSDWGGVSYENAYGYNAENDDGNYWIFYEVVDNPARSYTEVTFKGMSPGVTTATVGHVKYTITVNEDVRDITLYAGKSHTFTIENLAYTMDDVKVHPDNTYATLDSVESTTVSDNVELIPVTEIESGKQYVLLNNRSGLTLTSTTNDPGLKLAGVAALNTPYVWTIETTGDANDDGQVNATVRYGTDGGYLNVGLSTASLTTDPVTLQLDYQEDGYWLINDVQGYYGLNDYEQRYCAAGYTDAATDVGCRWTIYEVVCEDVSSTEVTFTGVSATTTPTTATIGGVNYNITVLEAPTEGDLADFNNIVGVDFYTDNNSSSGYRSDLDMAGKKVTSLRISEGAFFHLGVDITAYDDVIWTTADPTIATVDDDGNVTAVKAGETTVTATVVKDGVEESITIPVTVVPSMVEGYGDEDISPVFYYIEEIENTTPYYTMFLSTEDTSTWVDGHYMIEVTEGEVIWFERPTDSAFAWLWTADPDEAHALTLMTSSGSIAEYYPLKDTTGETITLGEGVRTEEDGSRTEYYVGNNAYNNIVNVGNDMKAYWTEKLHEVLNASIAAPYDCDGAMSNTRWGAGTKWPNADNVPPLITAMTFISDPMPEITKGVNGILPITRLQKDFRRYEDGMTATVGEYVYFQIDITLERPITWEDEANGIGAIAYSAAEVTDHVLSVLDESGNYVSGAYFYTKDLDMLGSENGQILDGVIDEAYRTTVQDITEDLNKAWETDETVRTLSFYLIYEITNEDVDDAQIENTANLSWNYKSHYSTGALTGAADADATITVVGFTIDDVVIDFGQSFVYTGLTADQMQHVSDGTFNTDYGTVTVTKEEDSTYTLTYTPTTILQAPDVVKLMGTYTQDGQTITRMVNSFTVYPATTVYYEEGFMFDNAKDWDTTDSVKASMNQEFERLGRTVKEGENVSIVTDKKHPYGFDPIYENTIGASSASQATATVAGASTSFTFTGTGFDLYANCTEETGYVLVYVKDAAGKTVKMYTVNTVVAEESTGSGDATDGQTGSMYSLPIVSEQKLAHGTYTVKIVKSMGGAVYIDGIRIFDTINEASYQTEEGDMNSPFDIDLEDLPEFYELRDYVLHAINVEETIESEDYGDVKDEDGNVILNLLTAQIMGQISADTEAPTAAILAGSKYNNDAQNLLDNGPKNELYLHAGETLVFNVRTNRKIQVGLKAPAAATSYSISYTVDGESGSTSVAANKALNSSVDMFYELANAIGTEKTYTITITNNGSNILSVTDLKICDDPNAAFVALTEADIKSTLATMGYGVAENTTTGVSYTTVSEALKAAQAGETVQLLTGCTESAVMVIPGVTLDLNGFELTADYAAAFDTAHIVDNAGGGSLIIGMSDLVLDEQNAMLPVYDGTGYIFVRTGFAFRQSAVGEDGSFELYALACPDSMKAVELLQDGGADNNIEIIVRLTWDGEQTSGSQDFKFSDAVVAAVFSSNTGTVTGYDDMFSMTISGFENVENLKAQILFSSGTDVERVSPQCLEIT